MVCVPWSLVNVQMLFGYKYVAKYSYWGLIVKIIVNEVTLRHDFPFILQHAKLQFLHIFSKISSTVRVKQLCRSYNIEFKEFRSFCP